MEPELVCIDSSGKANGLGLLKDGFLFKVNIEVSRRYFNFFWLKLLTFNNWVIYIYDLKRLLSGTNSFLKQLSKISPPFEIAVGLNGRVWLKTDKCNQTLFIVDAIKGYSNVRDSETETYIGNLSKNTSLYNE